MHDIYSVPAGGLVDWNHQLFQSIIKALKLDVRLSFNESFIKNIDDGVDLRSAIHPKKPFPKEFFPEYPQIFSDRQGFLHDLSIIDLLFNLGPDAGEYLEEVAERLEPEIGKFFV